MTATVYKASPTLARFMLDDSFVRAVVGPVGSGKSSACIIEIMRRAVAQAPGPDGVRRTRWAIIRNTYGQLRDTTRKTFEQWVPPSWGQWHEQQFSWRIEGKKLPDGSTLDCEVLFRALDRPEDVKKLLSLELTGAYINEAREVPRHVLDVLTSRVGRYPSKAQGGPSWFGVWLDTNPWHIGHWGYRLFSHDKPEGHALFEQPGGRDADAENLDNLPPGYYQRICHGKDSEWVAEYVDSRYPDSDKGSIYGHLLAAVKARGGLEPFDHPTDGVFTSWDLGISDSTAIWFWRLGKGVDVIDHYEAHGEALSHFFDVIDSKPYRYVKHWLPHDARARTLATGTSILDQFLAKYGPELSAIGPSLSLMDGIQAARWLLEQPETRFHPRCSLMTGPSDIDGLEALRSYRYEYDEATKAYSRKPMHDWSSHCFTPDTEVLIPNGMCRFDRLPPTGKVLTPCGWREYRSPRVSKRNARLVEVTFADGYSVRCTPEHLFLTESGWKSAQHLEPGSRIQSALTRARNTSTAGSIAIGRLASTSETSDGCTETSGPARSAQSPRARTSITLTATMRTIALRIWSACRLASIFLGWQRSEWQKAHTPASAQRPEALQPSGTAARPDASGTPRWPTAPRAGPSGSENSGRASIAARTSPPSSEPRGARPSTAPTVARPQPSGSGVLTITRVRELSETSDVWDITVPGVECFALANGAVVHNSADAFRYVATVAKVTEGLLRKDAKPGILPVQPVAMTLDALFEDNESRRKTRSRIG